MKYASSARATQQHTGEDDDFQVMGDEEEIPLDADCQDDPSACQPQNSNAGSQVMCPMDEPDCCDNLPEGIECRLI